jgi:hypothetical protein
MTILRELKDTKIIKIMADFPGHSWTSQATSSITNDLITLSLRYPPTTASSLYTARAGVTALDFMVEKMTATPLNDAQHSALSTECRQVIEEPTKRGFRVKLII